MLDTRRADDAAVLHHANPIREIKNVVNIVADKENADTFGLSCLTSAPTCAVSCGPSAAYLSSDGLLMPANKGQPPPDLLHYR
jgi:hypothetical protein